QCQNRGCDSQRSHTFSPLSFDLNSVCTAAILQDHFVVSRQNPVALPDVLCRLCGHAAVCTFGIDELRQQPTEILLLWWNAEEHASRAHIPVEGLHVGDSKPELDLSRRVPVRSRVQGESGFARREFTPTTRPDNKVTR